MGAAGMTERLFREDPYLLEFDARVVARRERDGRPAVVLDRTAFYAESGGQPWDTGRLDGRAVVAVVEDGDEILHVLDGVLESEHVHGIVDADRRRDHRQQHHGQHLLSRAFVEIASASTVSFHLGAEVSTIDLDREVGEVDVRRAEALANRVVWEARPVTVRTVSRREAEAMGVRAAEAVGDAVRLVDAGGFDLQPCGGTHPRTTADVGVVLVTGSERYKGGRRVRFVCGGRAVAAAARQGALLAEAAGVLSSGIEDVPEAVRRLRDTLAETERRSRELLEKALDGEARRLLADTAERPALVVAAYSGWPAVDLRVLAQHLTAIAPCVALLGSRADKAHLVFAQSDGLPHDIPGLLREAVSRLGGRGGGKGNLAQGGGDALDRLEDVLAAAAAAVRGASA
jgi:alanyl-tRNA synthetase